MAKLKNKQYITIGIVLLIYASILIAIRIIEGTPHTLLWITHTGLFLATLGFLLRSNFLLSSALVTVLFYHALWTIDFIIEFIGGGKFLEMTGYLHEVSLPFFIFTLHHIWLSPLLIFILYKEKRMHPYAWLGATALLLLSNILVIMLTPSNVNCAHAVCSSLENTFFADLARHGKFSYFAINIMLNALVVFYPLNYVLRYFIEKRQK